MKRFPRPLITALALLTLSAGTGEARQGRVFYRVQEMRECGRIGLALQTDARLGEVRVEEVMPGSPADRAGVRAGDIVVDARAGGTNLQGPTALIYLSPGQSVQLRTRRGGEERNVDLTAARDQCPRVITITAQPDSARQALQQARIAAGDLTIRMDTMVFRRDSAMVQALANARVLLERFPSVGFPADSILRRFEIDEAQRPFGEAGPRVLITTPAGPGAVAYGFEIGQRAIAGAEFSEMNADLAQYFEGVSDGILVLRVAPDTPSARAGLQPGDIVVQVGQTVIRSVSDLRRILAAGSGPSIRLDIVRKGRRLQIMLPTGR